MLSDDGFSFPVGGSYSIGELTHLKLFCLIVKRKLGQEGMVTPVWGLSAGFTVQIVIANEYKLDGL